MDNQANRSRWSRWLNEGTALGLFVGSMLTFVVAVDLFTLRPASDLTVGIGEGTWKQKTAEFDARLKRRFPVGTAMSEVTNTLRGQGFTSAWYFQHAGEFMAERDESSFACPIAAEVYWTLKDDNRLASIRGVYDASGCL